MKRRRHGSHAARRPRRDAIDDSAAIVVTGRRDGSLFVSDRGDDDDVLVMICRRQGRNSTSRTTRTSATFDPSWTPDGRILFTSERAASARRRCGGRRRGGHRARARTNGSAPSMLARMVARRQTGRLRVGDGPTITRLRRLSGRRDGRLTTADDSDPRFDDAVSRSWSRERYAGSPSYGTDEFGAEFLYTMNVAGTGLRFLLEAGYLLPEWSPTAQRLADRRSTAAIDVRRSERQEDGGSVTRPAATRRRSWSPDGRLDRASTSDRADEGRQRTIFVVAQRRQDRRRQLTDNDDEDVSARLVVRTAARSRSRAVTCVDTRKLDLPRCGADGSGVGGAVSLQAPAAMPSWQPLP